ncbi:hypothetical protein DFH09DRAFT_1077644 [Mycena vulgaris]|nr:hypothetical protein DFH09DRAFT_1077644 [Mycena vulgaris]
MALSVAISTGSSKMEALALDTLAHTNLSRGNIMQDWCIHRGHKTWQSVMGICTSRAEDCPSTVASGSGLPVTGWHTWPPSGYRESCRLKSKYTEAQYTRSQILETIMADLELRAGNPVIARSYLQKCINPSQVNGTEYTAWSLERLADGNRWSSTDWDSAGQRKLGIHKGLQLLGDILLIQADKDTAYNMFIVALDGLTQMDVHQSGVECMLRLGDITQPWGFTEGEGILDKSEASL